MDDIEEQGEMIQLALEHRIREAKQKTKSGRDRITMPFKQAVGFVCCRHYHGRLTSHLLDQKIASREGFVYPKLNRLEDMLTK